MAYKFQVGDATLSGSLKVKQGNVYVSGSLQELALRDDAAVKRFEADYNGSVVRMRLKNAAGATKAYMSEGATSVSGSGDILALGKLVVGANQYGINKNGEITGSAATLSGLTNTRITFAGVNGRLSDNAALTFNAGTSTLTATKIGAFEAAGSIDFSDEAMTNVNIDSGAIDGTAIGANSQSSVQATTISGSGALSAGGNLITAGTVKFLGSADADLDVGADSLYFLDADGLMKRDSVADIVGDIAGTVTTTGLAASSGVMSLAIHSLNAETIATGDKIAFSDSGDNGLHSETVDDLFTKGLPLVTEAAMAVADDYIVFLDGGASGDGKKEKWADLVSSAAGGGLSATNGVLSVQGNSSTQASSGTPLSEGYNYTTGSAGGAFLLPVNASVGDVVTLKIGAADGGKVTLSRQAAHTIDATLSSVSLDSAHAAVTLVYMVSGSWKIV
jgi:hypothetical protein